MNIKFMRPAIILIAGAIALGACGAPPTPQVIERIITTTPPPAAPTAAAPAPTQAPAAPAARTLNVFAGGGQDTTVEPAFFPQVIRVRTGDTVQWKVGGDEIHTVSFNPPPSAMEPIVPIPGGGPTDFMLPPELGFPTRAPGAPVEKFSGTGYANSGVLSKQPQAPGAPPNDTFTLTFDKPGTYSFVCLVHPYMDGAVVVVPATDTVVPSQADIDAQIKAQKGQLDAEAKAAADWSKKPVSVPGPNNTNNWFVNAGINVGDPRAAIYDFGPKALTVKAGDTVTWFAYEFHTVTFNPKPPPPDFIVPKPQGANKPPILSLNPKVLLPAKPSPTFDPAQYYNSGPMGLGTPAGNVFTLTFDKPGTYDYFCAVHVDLGMKGTIIVQAK